MGVCNRPSKKIEQACSNLEWARVIGLLKNRTGLFYFLYEMYGKSER